jgi:hypothetical protein
MSGRQHLLAEIEAKRRNAAKTNEIEVLAAELTLAHEDSGYDPYDRPGSAKPLEVDGGATTRLKALKKRRYR